MIFTKEELENFRYIVPVQGNIATLEISASILRKVAVATKEATEAMLNLEGDSAFIELDSEERKLLVSSINCLNDNCAITLQTLSLVKKILEG